MALRITPSTTPTSVTIAVVPKVMFEVLFVGDGVIEFVVFRVVSIADTGKAITMVGLARREKRYRWMCRKAQGWIGLDIVGFVNLCFG